MSRLARAIEILEVINEYFQEGARVLHADALLLEGDVRIKDAIAECLGGQEESEPEKIIPRSQQRSWGMNALEHWVGFIGKSKTRAFDFGKGREGQEAARRWANYEF